MGCFEGVGDWFLVSRIVSLFGGNSGGRCHWTGFLAVVCGVSEGGMVSLVGVLRGASFFVLMVWFWLASAGYTTSRKVYMCEEPPRGKERPWAWAALGIFGVLRGFKRSGCLLSGDCVL